MLCQKNKSSYQSPKKDLKIDYFRGSGHGGQKKQKTSSGVRITHIASKAVGQASDTRSQSRNKTLAFQRMADTDIFKKWLQIESAKKLGLIQDIEKQVEEEIKKVRIEVRENNQWKEVSNAQT